jgi:hypothetical protein
MFSKLLTAATVAVALTFAAQSQAHAAPVFLTPDVNYVSHGDSLFVTNPNHYSLSVNTAAGDFMSIDNGSGFSAISNGVIVASVTGPKTGSLALNIGGELGGSMDATLLTTHMVNNVVGGKDVLATFRVTDSTIAGFSVGQLIGLDILAFNGHKIDGVTAYQSKGDVAPLVPEPATMSLVLLGICGLAGSARRKLLV